MRVSLDHIKINVSDVDFYRSFFSYFDFKVLREYARGIGVTDGKVSIWVFKTPKVNEKEFNFKNTGLNHLAFKVKTRVDVDNFYKDFLLKNNIKVMHEPKEYPYSPGYYAVFFEDPDHLKLEVVYDPE